MNISLLATTLVSLFVLTAHAADGPGGPENSALAGLPAEYIVQQMNDYKSGARRRRRKT